ncbi:MAG: alpha/beta hydrolase [Hyphomicrobiales bacterium]|nr:MAG: alpha/beta hydrolase [Hyphomicrobiales bacterium]
MMNPELNAFLTRWDDEWQVIKAGATPADRRARFEIIAKNMRLPTPQDVETDAEHWIDSPNEKVRVRVFRHNSGGQQPCLVYMHGGAFMQGSPETHWDITSRIASWARQTVISVDYAKAPEKPFPMALDQVGAVIRWAHKNAQQLEIDPTKISIGGDSAGGNLAAAATLDVQGEIPLIAQLLIYPSCDFDRSRPSYKENPDGPIVKTAAMAATDSNYTPNPEDRLSPRTAPLLAPSHAGLPPAFVAVAECDPLRDSGIAYAEALLSAGVPVELDRGDGLIHGYLRSLEYCSDAHSKLEKMSAWLKQKNNMTG